MTSLLLYLECKAEPADLQRQRALNTAKDVEVIELWFFQDKEIDIPCLIQKYEGFEKLVLVIQNAPGIALVVTPLQSV